MIILGSRKIEFRNHANLNSSYVVRICTNSEIPRPLRSTQAFIVQRGKVPEGFGWYIIKDGETIAPELEALPTIVLPTDFEYLGEGDVVRIFPDRSEIRALYRRNSSHNSFLLTERCNHYCLMCSQPPRDVEDGWIFDEIMSALPLIDPDTPYLCFTGGEPTLLGDRFLQLILACKSYLPRTALMVLTNGRAFVDERFARALSDIRHPDLILGIPVYSDQSHIHDYVVQSDGAFDETVRGLINLRRHGVRIEIRVVLHKETVRRLPALAQFIARNLLFADHVALMGLEMTGFTRANIDKLWIDPSDYRAELKETVGILDRARMRVSIYNAQLCLTDQSVWRFTKRSISDWKQEYMPECTGCVRMGECAGFFASAKYKYSGNIKPFMSSVLDALGSESN